ncbi:hypothetical protein FGO68_gene15857 [Halteria grandinella]|uniref:cGMP-dependent protein kinase n=1 Tax=Halteria grandinella TaxID=5974 RepID=A0A8J8T810_HALGN|nr:hypothetical protein FGO68_gene15857 [Halteria grandinella]
MVRWSLREKQNTIIMGSCYCLNRDFDSMQGRNGAIDLNEFLMHNNQDFPRTVPIPIQKQQSEPVRFESPPAKKEGGIFGSPERELGPSGSDEISRTVFQRRKALYLQQQRLKQDSEDEGWAVVGISENDHEETIDLRQENPLQIRTEKLLNVKEIQIRVLAHKLLKKQELKEQMTMTAGPMKANLRHKKMDKQISAIIRRQQTLELSPDVALLRPMGVLTKLQKDLRSQTVQTVRELISKPNCLLSQVQKEVQDLFITHLNFFTMPAEQFLYKEGESRADYLFILLEGSVSKFIEKEEIIRLEAPQILGEEALLHSNLRNHSIISIGSEIKICGIHRDKFKELIKFVSPQHCSSAKAFFEQLNLFPNLERKQLATLVQEVNFVKFRKGAIIQTGAKQVLIVSKGKISQIIKNYNPRLRFGTARSPEPREMGGSGTTDVQLSMSPNDTADFPDAISTNLTLHEYSAGCIIDMSEPQIEDIFYQCQSDVECYAINEETLKSLFKGNFRNHYLLNIMSKNDSVVAKLSKEHIIKIIEGMRIQMFKRGEIVFKSYSEKHQKFIVCISGRLISHQNGASQQFLSEGQSLGGQDIYNMSLNNKHQQSAVGGGTDQFQSNIYADPYCILAEVSREALEDSIFGEDFYSVVQKNTIIRYLQKIPAFSFLPFSKLEWISEAFHKQKFLNGNETLFSQDQQTDSRQAALYIIHSGSVDLFVNHGQTKVSTLGIGSYFGERDLIFMSDQSSEFTATVAEPNTVIYMLKRNDYTSLIEANLRKLIQSRIIAQGVKPNFDDLTVKRKVEAGPYSFRSIYEVESKISLSRYHLHVFDKTDSRQYKYDPFIEAERSILVDLDHPFIQRFSGTYRDKQRACILRESFSGVEILRQQQEFQILNKREAQFNIASILLVVEYLHNMNILHRDIRPDTLYLDEQGYIKFSDFTCAKKIEDRAYTFVGTPEYTAPEVFLSSGYDFSADYWSIGVCLYEFLTGQLPFGNGETSDTLSVYLDILSRVEKGITFPEHFRDEVAKDLILKLLNHNPQERLSTPAELKEHQWFENFDFDALSCHSLQAPYIPKMKDIRENKRQFELKEESKGLSKSQQNPLQSLKKMQSSGTGQILKRDKLWAKTKQVQINSLGQSQTFRPRPRNTSNFDQVNLSSDQDFSSFDVLNKQNLCIREFFNLKDKRSDLDQPIVKNKAPINIRKHHKQRKILDDSFGDASHADSIMMSSSEHLSIRHDDDESSSGFGGSSIPFTGSEAEEEYQGWDKNF